MSAIVGTLIADLASALQVPLIRGENLTEVDGMSDSSPGW
uniref:Uncharacterized protein n=1 Tax=Setaria digitata TaxID=48799 RepID=A0A915PD40_9BILA